MERKIPDNDKYFLFGTLPVVQNHIQALGDKITGEITFKQWFVMLIVRDMPEGSSVTEIAGQHGSSRQNVKRILDSLKAKGYVSMEPDPEDMRGYAVSLTASGKKVMDEISVVGGKFVEDIFTGVAIEDIVATKRVFIRLLDNLSRIEAENHER